MDINTNRKFPVDVNEYPFESRWYETPEGKLHYVDEGQGEVMLFVHGTPTWSFLYRNQIKFFSKKYRCVALDHLGFGLSDKPTAADYKPQDHARRLEEFIDHLRLQSFTLLVHDFGGPIGLAYALNHPGNLKRIVLFNTWLWSNDHDVDKTKVCKLLRSPVGAMLYQGLNVSPKFLLKMGFADKRVLTKSLHAHYLRPFPSYQSRKSLLVLGSELLSEWYATLWEKRARIAHIPAQVIWGMQDVLFKESDLQRWEQVVPMNRIARLERTGHFPQEEAPEQVVEILEKFFMET